MSQTSFLVGTRSRKVLLVQQFECRRFDYAFPRIRSRAECSTQRCNCYAYSTIKAPDKGEVGGSSPPRPTIQITSKYAAILTFPLFGDLPQKTVLSTVCQLYDWPDSTTLRGVKTVREGQTDSIDSVMSRTLPSQLEGRARQCKTLQGCGTSGKSFSVSLRGVVQLTEPMTYVRRHGPA